MDYIRKLPFILGASAAVIVGLFEYINRTAIQSAYTKMLISLLVFYFIGIYIRSTLVKINEEVDEKKEQEEKERLAQLEAENLALHQQTNEDKVAGANIDYKVEDLDDEFKALKISEMIKTKE